MTDIDELMSRDPLDLAATDIDEIIAYERTQRARRAAGEKVSKPKVSGLSDVLSKIVQKAAPAQPKIERRRL